MTLEDIWSLQPRATPEKIHEFYRDMGAWAAFRQVVYRRNHEYGELFEKIFPGMRFCEYGAGVGSVSFWLLQNHASVPLEITIVDVPSEHLNFGGWRIRRRILELKSPAKLTIAEVQPGQLPLQGEFDLITILEVFEHLHNPREVIEHLINHLRPEGVLWENYISIPDPGGPDLEASQNQRDSVFEYLRNTCNLISGEEPDSPAGGNRCWRKK